MNERQRVNKFRKAVKDAFANVYLYEYPDTGRAAAKKKPPDFLCIYKHYTFIIEFKIPGGTVLPHQKEHLIKAHNQGAVSYVGIFLENGDIFFEPIHIKPGFIFDPSTEMKNLFNMLKKGGAI